MRFLRFALMPTLAAMLIAAGALTTSPAKADEYQANLLGWQNCCWGNRGAVSPANEVVNAIAIQMTYGHPLPLVVSTQETCWRAYGGNPNNQFDTLYSALSYISGSTYSYAFAWNGPPGTPDPTAGSQCGLAGDGVIARAYSPSAEWAWDYKYQLPGTPSTADNHQRWMACTYPSLYLRNYAACTAHLSTDDSIASAQQLPVYYSKAFGVNPGYYRFVTGDFNITPNQGASPPAYSATVNGAHWYTSSAENPTEEIDHTFFTVTYSQSVNASRYLPQPCGSGNPWNCTNLQNHRISDHWFLLGYAN